jgi:outer membrane protein
MNKMMLALLATAALTSTAHAEEGKWMVRARALGVVPQEDSSISPIGGKAAVDNSVVPEVDVSYFFTDNIAAELIAAVTPHDVNAKGTALGNVDVGSAWLLPPTLTLQYHFTGLPNGIKPYLGAGINYTHFYNEDAGALNTVEYEDSFGTALQAGVDIPVQDNWYLNLDVKKVFIDTTAKFNGGAVRANVDIDPLLIGAGVGYRF